MFCPKCGKENPDIARFCAGCGSTLQGVVKKAAAGRCAPAGAPRKRAGRRTAITIAIAIAIAAALLWILAGGGPGRTSGSAEPRHFFETVYDKGVGKTLIAVDGTAFKGAIDGALDYNSCGPGTDLYSEKALYVDTERTLWLLTPKRLVQVAGNVAFASISQNGASIAYIDEDGGLNLYTVSGKSIAVIDGDLYENDAEGGKRPLGAAARFAMSPDGKTVCYCKYDSGNDGYTAYIYDGKESRKLKNDTIPVSVGDGGRHIYCFDTGRGNLVYFADASSNSVKVSSADGIGFALMNRDRTQMVFINDGSAYFTDRGSETLKFPGSGYSGIFPLAGPYPASYSYTPAPSLAGVYVAPAKSLKGRLFSLRNGTGADSGSDIVAFGAKGGTNRVVSDVDGFVPTKTGAIYYVKKGNLYSIDEKGKNESERLARSVSSFAPASDGSRVYYLDDEGGLYYTKGGGGDPEKITDDVHSMQLAYDDTLFFIADFSSRAQTGSLYGCRSEKDIEKIMDDVLPAFRSSCGDRPYTLFYEESGDGEYDIYAVRSGVKAEAVFEGVVQ